MFKCVISFLEIKSFVPLKNESLLFWTRVHFKRGGKSSSSKFEGGGGGLLIKVRFRI